MICISFLLNADCLITDCRTAELSKLVENSFRDVNIAFANELSLICDKLKINVWDLIKLANRHPRVNILQPGPGVGGHCVAVDPWFIVNLHNKKIYTTSYFSIYSLEKIKNEALAFKVNKSKDPVIACMGLAFKPDIDDLRESPALCIARKIRSISFSSIFLVEPNINRIPSGFDSDNIELVGLESAIKSADIIILLVDHTSFKSMDLSLLSGKQVIDTRGIWS